jgi:hypothetical protein
MIVTAESCSDEMTELWLIWSSEHQAWWKGAQSGYTEDVSHAGRYSREEAEEICVLANENNEGAPLESMVPARIYCAAVGEEEEEAEENGEDSQ